MKRIGSALSETQVPVPALAVMTMFFLGSGCVGLDKPAEVAKCSTGDQVCLDGVRRDSGIPQGGKGGVVDGGNDQGAAGGAAGSGSGGTQGTGGTGAGVQDAGGQGGGIEAGPGIGGALGGDGGVSSTDDAALVPDVPLDGLAGAVDVVETPPSLDASASGGGDAAIPDVALASDAGGKDTSGAPDVRPGVDSGISSSATVTFNQGVASGPMTGYGWVTLGSADSVTSPTCGTGTPTITSANPCLRGTIWNSPSALCVTGAVPALPAVPTAADYANNWGLQVGVNAKEPNAVMAQSFSTITINFSAAPVSELRVELHRSGDLAGATYCFTAPTSGETIPLAQFNTKCWDGTGTALTAADVLTIDSVGLQVTSGSSAITVTNLCLNSIVFGS